MCSSRSRTAMPTAAMIEVTALNTKTKPIPPNWATPNAPMDGPSSSPPIWAAPYSPNASPRRSLGVASVRKPRAAGS